MSPKRCCASAWETHCQWIDQLAGRCGRSPPPPVEDRIADLVVSGWSVSYLAVWNPDSWRKELEKWMGEMKRILKAGGFIVLVESLGTGNEIPSGSSTSWIFTRGLTRLASGVNGSEPITNLILWMSGISCAFLFR